MKRTHLLRAARAVGLTAVAALALSACSGQSGTDDEASGPTELTPITVGILPTAPSAAVLLGVNEGIFEEHGLDVTLNLGQGSTAMLPAVSSQSLDFAVGGPLPIVTATSQGLDLRIVSGYSNVDGPEGEEPTGIVVRPDSGIETWSDLEGKTIAVNVLGSPADLGLKVLVEEDGGDPGAVSVTEIPLPDQQVQIEEGRIDGGWLPEPLLSRATDAGLVSIGDPIAGLPGMISQVAFTSGAYADANPEVVEAFRAALADTIDLANSDPGANLDAIAELTELDPAVVESITLEQLSADLDPKDIDDLSEMAVRFGFAESAPSSDDIVLK